MSLLLFKRYENISKYAFPLQSWVIMRIEYLMKDKLRLWCDLNTITDINDMEHVATLLAKFPRIVSYHRYDYLFQWYHNLVNDKIDEEQFFTLGDVTWSQKVFSTDRRTWLDVVFSIEENYNDDTLYIVEQSAREYYLGKVGHDRSGAFRKDLTAHWSDLLVV